MSEPTESQIKRFDERAELLAKPKEDKSIVQSSTILIFKTKNEGLYACHYRFINRISNMMPYTAIPGLPSPFLGMIYNNSEIWPVVQSQQLLNTEQPNYSDPTALILLKYQNIKVALTVYEIIGLEPFQASLLNSEMTLNQQSPFFQGIYNSNIVMLNARKILDHISKFSLEKG
jgi:chemotaxis signal transduction protein